MNCGSRIITRLQINPGYPPWRSKPSEPLIADPHDQWCGMRGFNPPADPIRFILFHQGLAAAFVNMWAENLLYAQ